VSIVNLGESAFTITRGMRIAQLVIAPVTRAAFVAVDALSESERGGGGFGSTGLKD
jgi:dUTP pyrophosphatase